VSAARNAMPSESYISPTMRLFRRRKRPARLESGVERPVSRVDRSAHALDVQLVSLASAGDDFAFATLVTRYQPAVFRWALVFAQDPDEAEDLVQEVFVRAHRNFSRYRSDAPLGAWLYAITRSAANQSRRSRKRRKRLSLSPSAMPYRDVYTTDPGGRVDRERAAALIRELFPALPSRQREIFDLVDLQGLSPAEAAERTGMKPVTVRANLFKARAAIRAKFLATHPSYGEIDK
jgi:RNA polymerase sigma-70 factor (ECF subfamily)